MPRYEHETLAGAINLAVKGKGKGKDYRKQGQRTNAMSREGRYTDHDQRVRAQADRPNGPSVHDNSAWEVVPYANGGGQFPTGRYLRFSTSQIADPFGGASRNIFGFVLGRAASGGFARFSFSAHPINGGAARIHRMSLRAPVHSQHFEGVDLGSNPRGHDQYNVMLMLGGANFMTADHPDNFDLKVYRERNYQQIGIARHVERVNFTIPGR